MFDLTAISGFDVAVYVDRQPASSLELQMEVCDVNADPAPISFKPCVSCMVGTSFGISNSYLSVYRCHEVMIRDG